MIGQNVQTTGPNQGPINVARHLIQSLLITVRYRHAQCEIRHLSATIGVVGETISNLDRGNNTCAKGRLWCG